MAYDVGHQGVQTGLLLYGIAACESLHEKSLDIKKYGNMRNSGV